jgi:predicted nuclease of predicted toxin-antitoxin system
MWIIVEDGEVFEGDELHWEDCFFTNATETEIRKFCRENGWKVVIQDQKLWLN